MKTATPYLVTLCLTVLISGTAMAGGPGEGGKDWPQWRGPERAGLSIEIGWSAVGQSRSLWAKQIGFGHSSFAVADGRLFAMGYDLEGKQDVIRCLDPVSGEDLWTYTHPAEFWNEGHDGGTCTTPTVAGNTVFVSNREGLLLALDVETGSVRWTQDMQALVEVSPPRWGFSGSPIVAGDLVVANVGKLAAFDRTTGELRWTTDRGYGNAYSTPTEYDFLGRPSILALNGTGLAVIDQADGSELAFHPWTRDPAQAVYGATPVIVDDRIFLSAGSGSGCVMLEPDEESGLEVVWESRVMRSSYAGCVLHEDHLFGFDASILKCIDLDGNEKWRQRGIGLGAMVVVGGRLLILGAKGELIVAEATPERYVELSREKVLEGGAFWSTPVLSHGLVYARNSLGDMVCRDHRTGPDTRSKRHPDAPAELLEPAALLARHLEAIGGADALRALESVHLTGQGEGHGSGPIYHCDAVLSWAANAGFSWRFSTGLAFGYNSDLGWNKSPRGPQVLDDDGIAELEETGNLHRMLAADWGFAELDTLETRVFDDRLCYVVDARLASGTRRTLYFEVESGLLAGQEGDEVPLWIFDDYQAIGGVKLPMEWSSFEPRTGSMILASFSDAVVNEPKASDLEPPLLIQMMTRSAEEREAANEALRGKYADLVGAYQLATGSMTGAGLSISIAEGGLRYSFAGQPASYLSEPDQQGRVYDMANLEIYIQVDREEAGAISRMRLFAYGDEFGTIERVASD